MGDGQSNHKEVIDTVTITDGTQTEEDVEERVGVEEGFEKVVETEEVSVNESGWTSHAKPCRSLKSNSKLESNQGSILSNLRFSILSTEKEGEIPEEDTQEGEQSTKQSTEQSTEQSPESEQSSQNSSPSTKNSTVVKQQRGKEVVIPRQSLPRESKDNHKFLSDSTA